MPAFAVGFLALIFGVFASFMIFLGVGALWELRGAPHRK